jgi:hypothetical protein
MGCHSKAQAVPVSIVQVQEPNGEKVLTANPSDIPNSVWSAWKGIFQREANFSWPLFHKEYAREISSLKTNMPSLTFSLPSAHDLWAWAKKMDASSPMGPDGRAPAELKRLPLWYWDQVALFWQTVFKGAPRPTQPLQAHVAFIPKPGDGPKTASDLRPITILSASYRVFSSCMFRKLLKWHDSWCPEQICGGRPGADALRAAIELGFTLEEAMLLASRGLLLVSLDLPKFFDSIEWGLIQGLAMELGMPPHIMDAFLAFLSELKRRLKVGDTFSRERISTTCGTPQGDALSILWANLASVILSKRLSALKISVGHKIYVDDRYIYIYIYINGLSL